MLRGTQWVTDRAGWGRPWRQGEGRGLKDAFSWGAATSVAAATPRHRHTAVTSPHLLQDAEDLGFSRVISQWLSAGSFISKALCEAGNTPLLATFAHPSGRCDYSSGG